MGRILGLWDLNPDFQMDFWVQPHLREYWNEWSQLRCLSPSPREPRAASRSGSDTPRGSEHMLKVLGRQHFGRRSQIPSDLTPVLLTPHAELLLFPLSPQGKSQQA